MNGKRSAFLLVLGERAALAWVLQHERMAFSLNRRREAAALTSGDLLLLYTTRGCFHNPTRDRGRVIGEARVKSAVDALDPPVELVGRQFAIGCRIEIMRLAPVRKGVELSPLVPRLKAFPDPESWSARMRRPLVPLPWADARLLRSQLGQFPKVNVSEVIAGYRALANR